MIQVRYFGGLGNRLFQYCTGRILAEELGFFLLCPGIVGFPGTLERVPGGGYRLPRVKLSGGIQNLKEVARDRTRRFIELAGACCMHYERDYRPYAERMRKWCRPKQRLGTPPEGTLYVHVRLGDMADKGYQISEGFYEELLEKIEFDQLVVVTDEPGNAALRVFDRWKPVVSSGGRDSMLYDFHMLCSARRLVISGSTFSWWAAFLGQASLVYFPLPQVGYWSDEFPEVDLRVQDDRYIYVKEPR